MVNKTKNEKAWKVFKIISFILILILLGFLIYIEAENKGFQRGVDYAKEHYVTKVDWGNWVVSGENVSIYFNGQEFVDLEGEKSFSWWMKCVPSAREIGIWNRTITEDKTED